MARRAPKAVSKDDAEVLQNLEETLKRVVYGQDKAIKALSELRSSLPAPACASRKSRSAATCSSGPTGVGKTEVAKASLRAVLGVELIRFDMSEYMERHTVSRLIGAPPGYVGFDQRRGNTLTDGVDQHPHCVLLLDEIEESASGPVQCALADHGSRQADRPQRQAGRLPACDPDHDNQCRRRRHGAGRLRLHAHQARG